MQFRKTTQAARTGMFSVFLCSLSRAVLMVMHSEKQQQVFLNI